MINQLARDDAELRVMQAKTLVNWARAQTLPIIAVGDYGLDYDFKTERGNEAFAALLDDNVFHWVKPRAEGNRNLLEEFVFVAGSATEWDVRYKDDKSARGHKPVEVIIDYKK